VVITNMAVFRFDGITGETLLAGHYPSVAIQKILNKMKFSADVSKAQQMAPPTEHELRILREKRNPNV